MPTVFIDTNIFFLYHKGINVFEELRFLIPGNLKLTVSSGVLYELKSLNKNETKLIFKIIKAYEEKGQLDIIESDNYVDEWLINYTNNLEEDQKKDFIVCTNDFELKQKLKNKKIRIISPKSSGHLEFV